MQGQAVPSLCLLSSLSVCFHLEGTVQACAWPQEVISMRVAACILTSTGCGPWMMERDKHQVKLQEECAMCVNFRCLFMKWIEWSEAHWRYDADIPWTYYPYFWTVTEELCEMRAMVVALFLWAHRCTSCSSCAIALCGVYQSICHLCPWCSLSKL